VLKYAAVARLRIRAVRQTLFRGAYECRPGAPGGSCRGRCKCL